jgi:phosphopantothenoylcysteine decarboxylase/phosphopantothenate--cysteine ligase
MGQAGSSPLAGRTVVVTAGGTREPIDPVRYLGNRSSGKMGNALAVAAADRGASVILVTTVAPPDHPRVEVVAVDTAEEMNAAVRDALPGAALLVMAAAVADYRVTQVASGKMKKRDTMTLSLVPTIDILRSLAADPLRDGVFVVGFAAETDDAEVNAVRKLADKRLDLVVLNDVSRAGIGMGSDENEVTVFDAAGAVAHLAMRPKPMVAVALLDLIEERLPPSGSRERPDSPAARLGP